jgi:hypothetical protein
MVREWYMKFDPYKMKSLRELKPGESNPFHYMSLYAIQQHIKLMEKSDDPPFKKENEDIDSAINMIVLFKDLLHITTSEAVATYMIFKYKLEARARQDKLKSSDISDELLAEIAHEAVVEFRSDWQKAMNGLQELWKE